MKKFRFQSDRGCVRRSAGVQGLLRCAGYGTGRCWRVLALFLIVSCLLSIAGPVSAQEAFYIYRNDGDFDGFFFDQVVRMGYSKTDLEGVEHDVFVVQEVETADSLYRIPLAAIDSVGFQQPEIRLNPRLKVMDDLPLGEHFIQCGTNGLGEQCVWFDIDLPADQLPEAGDVLVGQDERFKDGTDEVPCAGRVREVLKLSSEYVVKLDPLSDWGDLFEQFVTVEQIGTDAEGNIRRRIAGVNPDGTLRGGPRRAGGNVDVTLFNWSGRLQYELYHTDNSSVNVGLDLGFKTTAQAVYRLTGFLSKRFFMKLVFAEEFSAGLSVHAQFSGTKEWPMTPPFLKVIPSIKFPAFFPLFEVDPTPEGFFRIGGSVDFGLQLPNFKFGFTQTYVLDTGAEDKCSFSWGNLDKNEEEPDLTESDFSWLSEGVVFNAFAQAGAKVSLGVKTNSWLSDLLHAGIAMEIYAGPKIEGEVNLTVDGTKDTSYNLLKDSKVELSTLSFDRELKYGWKVGSEEFERTLWNDTQKFGTVAYYLYPDFNASEARWDSESKVLHATVHPRRNVVKTSEIGIGVYDGRNTLAASRFGRKYGFGSTFNDYSAEFTASELCAGVYRVRPLVKMVGDFTLPVNGAETAPLTVPLWLQLETDSVSPSTGNATTIAIPYTTNGGPGTTFEASLTDYSYHGGDDGSETCGEATVDTENSTLRLALEKNPHIWGRRPTAEIRAIPEEYGLDSHSEVVRIWQPGTGVAKSVGLTLYCREGQQIQLGHVTSEGNVQSIEYGEDGEYHDITFPCTFQRNGHQVTISFDQGSQGGDIDGNTGHCELDIRGTVTLDLTPQRERLVSGSFYWRNFNERNLEDKEGKFTSHNTTEINVTMEPGSGDASVSVGREADGTYLLEIPVSGQGQENSDWLDQWRENGSDSQSATPEKLIIYLYPAAH